MLVNLIVLKNKIMVYFIKSICKLIKQYVLSKDRETKSYLDKMYTGKVQLDWWKSQVMTEPTSEVGGTKWGCKTRNTAGFEKNNPVGFIMMH